MKQKQRVNYFQGMMLVDDDFREDQTYHRQMLGDHNLELHTWGVVRGLEVSINAGKLDVREGVAIDTEGKQIWWKGGDPTPVGTPSDGAYIVIEWTAQLTEEYSQMPGNFLRLIETCTFSFKNAFETGDVVLARIRVQRNQIQADIDNSVRRTASSVRVNPENNNLEIQPVTKDASLRLMTGLTERLTIDRTGNVGVGTTTPTQRLQVEGGDILVKGAGGFSTGQEARLYFGDTNHYIKAISGSGVRIGSLNAVDAITLLQGGNVGIGTTDPGSSRLKIANTSSDFVDVRFGESGTGQLEIYGWSRGWNINAKPDGKHLFLNRDSEQNSNVSIGRNGKELFVRGSDGKVGIGTNDPQASLHVKGSQGAVNIEGTDHVYVQWFPLGFSSGRKGLMGYGSPNEKHFSIRNEIPDGHILLNAGSGRVGIGTTGPAAAFQVRGTPGNIGEASFFNDVSAMFACRTDNGGDTARDPETVMVLAREGVERQSHANFVRFDLGMYGEKKTQLNIRLNHDPRSEANNTPVTMSLRSNSNIGIGTAQPSAKLEIQGGAGKGGESDPKAMAFSYSTGGFRHWIRTRHNLTPGAGNAIDFYVNNSATAEGSSEPTVGTLHTMTLDAGRVGIGTTSPGSDLHIRRDASSTSRLGPTLLIQNGGGGENAEARIDISTYEFGDASPNFRLRVIDDGSNGAHVDFTTKLSIKDNRAALVSRLYIKSDGNIGIATTQPKAKLEIQGGADTDGASDPCAVAFSHRSGGFRHWIRTRHNSTLDKGNAIDFYVNNSTAADGSSAPATGTLHVMTLDTGKVGIGITEPKETLDVGGDVRLSENNLYFRDKNHGIGFYGGTKKFNAEDINGPVVYGWNGGALGINQKLANETVQRIALRWDVDGNVSIGKKLKVSNAIAGFGLEPSDGSPNAGYIRFGDKTGWKLHFGQASSGGTALTGLSGVIMTLQDKGNVGIGTTSPDAPLEIKGTASEVRVKFGGTGGDVHHLSSNRDLVFNSATGLFTFRKVEAYGDATNHKDLLTISADGNISSPKWNVTLVINQAGPLNISRSFSTGGGRLVIFASGSAFRTNAGTIGMYVYLDGTQVGVVKGYTNESQSHKSLVSFPIVVAGIGAGSHTIELRPLATDVYMDGNDYFNVTVLELPF